MKSTITLSQVVCSGAALVVILGSVSTATSQIHQNSAGSASFDRMKSAGIAVMMYVEDNNQYFPFSDRGSPVGFGAGRPDYVWFELVEPYLGTYLPTESPFDPVKIEDRHLDPFTGQPLSPDDPNYWYAVAERSNVGLNFDFLSPWFIDVNGFPYQAGSKPTRLSAVAQPAKTMFLASSTWDRDTNGVPTGGGNWVVEAPCFSDSDGRALEPMASMAGIWQSYGGWQPGTNSFLEFGAMWPWYQHQKFQYMMLDGTIRVTDIGPLTAGCDVQPHGAGRAFDGDAYIWDLR